MLMTVHSFSTQYNTEKFLPSYLQTNIIAQMLSIGGEGAKVIKHHSFNATKDTQY